jgi:hypothetical protein
MKNLKYFLVGLLLVGCAKSVVVPPPVADVSTIDSQSIKTTVQQTTGIEVVTVDPSLKSKHKGVIQVPVVIINYVPIKKGTDGLYYLNNDLTLNSNIPFDAPHKMLFDRAKTKILTDKIIEKNAIEEGSRFRDYTTNIVKPYVDIDVVAYINVYDVKYIQNGTKLVDTTDDKINNPVTIPWYKIDYIDIMNRVNLKNYVENLGVKEVWLTTFPKEAGYLSFNVSESNMSPSINWVNARNVSNGGNQTLNTNSVTDYDLPRYNNTYVVYGDNGWRGADTDLHNRGHQLEAQLTFLDNQEAGDYKFLWTSAFLPKDSLGAVVKRHRLGNTHYPASCDTSYGYWSNQSSYTDITDWKPSGGKQTLTSVGTWLNRKYSFENTITMSSPGPFATGSINYSNDAQVKWFIFWWQSIPGYNNNITDTLSIGTPTKNITMTNWWDIFYNWDSAISNKTKLYK